MLRCAVFRGASAIRGRKDRVSEIFEHGRSVEGDQRIVIDTDNLESSAPTIAGCLGQFVFALDFGCNGYLEPLSQTLIALTFRPPRDGICDPSVNVGFMPACPIGADLELSWECALGNLTVDRGPG